MGKNVYLLNLGPSLSGGNLPKFTLPMSRLVLLREWRDMDVSPRRRKDTLREGELDGVIDERRHF